MKRFIFLIILLTALLLAACSQKPEASSDDQPDYKLGETVFQANCSSCHSANSDIVLVGPSMLGIAERAGNMVVGMDAYTYVERSIIYPSEFLNAGFPDLMPANYGDSLTSEEIEAVIQYVMSLDK